MGQWVGAQGRPKMAYFSKTCPLCDVTSRKPHRNRKSFFSILTTRLAESVEGLNSSLAQSPGELQDCKVLQEKWRTRDLKGFEELIHIWQLLNQVSEKTKVRVDTCYVQNDVTIHLNRSTERKHRWTNNERTMVNEQNPHLVPHDNCSKFKSANLTATRANLQLQCCHKY